MSGVEAAALTSLTSLTALEKELLSEHFSGQDYENAVIRYQNGEPLAYIIGEWYFYGLTFKLNRHCLIPRPDTEHVVEKAIELTPKGGAVLDLCTGSGCIAVSLVKNRPDIRACAVDISTEALRCAEINARENGVDAQSFIECNPKRSDALKIPEKSGMIAFTEADIFDLSLPENSFDMIISNPPYIKTEVLPTLDTVRHEPVTALDGGEDGMKFYRHMVQSFYPALKKDGKFIFEIGYDQAQDMQSLAEERGLSCEIFKDYGGNDRVAVLSGMCRAADAKR